MGLKRRVLAIFLSFLLVSSCWTFPAFAEETGSDAASDGTAGGGLPELAAGQGAEGAIESEEDSSESDGLLEERSDSSAAQESASLVQDPVEVLEFVYIEQGILAVGDTQHIAFALTDGNAVIQNASLELQKADADGSLRFDAENIVQNSALFSFAFDEGQEDSYLIQGFAYEADGISHYVSLSPNEMIDASGVLGEDVQETVEVGAVEGREADDSHASSVYAFDVIGKDLMQDLEIFESMKDEGVLAFAVDESGELRAFDEVGEAISAADPASAQGGDSSDEGLSLSSLESLLAPKDAAYAATDGLVVAIDPGHGGSDPGALGNGLRESDVNLSIAKYCKGELDTYYDVRTFLTRTGDVFIGLQARVEAAVAGGADVIVSLHCNAGGGRGVEVIVPGKSSWKYNETHVVGEELGNKILDQLVSLGLSRRSVFSRACTNDARYPDGSLEDYFTVIATAREYGIPGIIVEHAFIDASSGADKNLLSTEAGRKKLGIADAKGIAEQYGLSKTAPVIPLSTAKSHRIMGASQASVDDMVAWYEAYGKPYPSKVYTQYGAATIRDFCRILLDEASAEGVRAEVVFAQAMLETGYLQFGGDVKPAQCNFAGIGATGGVPGASFNDAGAESVAKGLRAQVQHLKAYAATGSLTKETVDPRFSLVTRGCAPYVENLSGRWAVNKKYGYLIANMIDGILGNEVSYSDQDIAAAEKGSYVDPGIDDRYLKEDVLAAQNAAELADGVYLIRAKKDLKKAIETARGSRGDIANVQLGGLDAVASQRWRVSHDNLGYVIIANDESGSVLEVRNSSIVWGSNIQVNKPSDVRSQRWIVRGNKIISALSADMVLDLANGETGEGTNVQLYVDNGTSAQQFEFVDVSAYEPTRLWGDYALDTMMAITQEAYPDASCDSIVVATRDAYYDALTASGFAGVFDCPVLMTAASGLSWQTVSEIERLAAKGGVTVYIAGSSAALSESIERDIANLSCVNKTTRMEGDDAIGTSLGIYYKALEVKGSSCWGNTCIVATDGAYYDALSASPYAFAKKAPVFLARAKSNSLRDSVIRAIKDGGFSRVLILGSSSAISDGIQKQLETLPLEVIRLGGDNAFDTSEVIANFSLKEGFSLNKGAITTAAAYYDGLVAGPLCGKNKAPMVLVWDGVNISKIERVFGSSRNAFDKLYVFGGPAAINDETFSKLFDVAMRLRPSLGK